MNDNFKFVSGCTPKHPNANDGMMTKGQGNAAILAWQQSNQRLTNAEKQNPVAYSPYKGMTRIHF